LGCHWVVLMVVEMVERWDVMKVGPLVEKLEKLMVVM
jgi:hypothetical protein